MISYNVGSTVRASSVPLKYFSQRKNGYNSEAIERTDGRRTNGARSGGRESHKSSEGGDFLFLFFFIQRYEGGRERGSDRERERSERVIYFAHSTSSCLELETVHSDSLHRERERGANDIMRGRGRES